MLKKKILLSILPVAIVYLAIVTTPILASDYVLPYPSFMPGNRLYAPRQVWEKVMLVWHFGDISRAKYHLSLSDRYLIEAKILFEYDQYLLAVQALKKSNNHFAQATLYVQDIEGSGKDNGRQAVIINSAHQKHTDVLTVLDERFSEDVVWTAEKEESITIPIPFLIRQSKIIRSYAATTEI